MTQVVVWPHTVRIVPERIPEMDRPALEQPTYGTPRPDLVAVRWVRPFPTRRVLAQMVYPSPPFIGAEEGLARVGLWWDEMDEAGRLECTLGLPFDDDATACMPLGQIIRLPSDRKYPYDPQREAEDILATILTGTGAVPVADRMIASLEKNP